MALAKCLSHSLVYRRGGYTINSNVSHISRNGIIGKVCHVVRRDTSYAEEPAWRTDNTASHGAYLLFLFRSHFEFISKLSFSISCLRCQNLK